MTDEQVEALVKAIAEIPARGGGVMELYPATLRQKLSPEMIRTIARAALAAAQAGAAHPNYGPCDAMGPDETCAMCAEIAAAQAGAPSEILLTGPHPYGPPLRDK